jgi:hypothetical protein
VRWWMFAWHVIDLGPNVGLLRKMVEGVRRYSSLEVHDIKSQHSLFSIQVSQTLDDHRKETLPLHSASSSKPSRIQSSTPTRHSLCQDVKQHYSSKVSLHTLPYTYYYHPVLTVQASLHNSPTNSNAHLSQEKTFSRSQERLQIANRT